MLSPPARNVSEADGLQRELDFTGKWQLTYHLTQFDVFTRAACFSLALATRRSILPSGLPPVIAFFWEMHLVFSTSDYMNSDISDVEGRVLFTVSTPRASKRLTTITKYRWSGRSSVSETMATIEWHELKGTLVRFNGDEIKADAMLWKRRWSTYVRLIVESSWIFDESTEPTSGRYFVGPDKHTYKWKLESTHCWMKLADSNVALARFHKKNLGIRKESHPPYLDVSRRVVSMLDHVILTYVYVESLRRERLGHLTNT